jgi:phosphatidylethanolamine/phosphatidyl-N-methylethanolamine N-methyltransferase
MSHNGHKPEGLSAEASEQAGWTFFRQWLKNPLAIAAVSPSSRELAQKMLRELPEGASRVIELGGGTGVFTRALLEKGIRPENLLVLELNQALHQHLMQRFPEVRVACADARDLKLVAQQTGFFDDGPADGVISGLGLLSMSKPLQKSILEAAFSVLGPQGRFIQFTYGPINPVGREVMQELELTSHRAGFTLLNLPPAAVYVISRARSKRVHPVRAARV